MKHIATLLIAGSLVLAPATGMAQDNPFADILSGLSITLGGSSGAGQDSVDDRPNPRVKFGLRLTTTPRAAPQPDATPAPEPAPVRRVVRPKPTRQYAVSAQYPAEPPRDDALPPGRYIVRFDVAAMGLTQADVLRIDARGIADILSAAIPVDPWQIVHIYRHVYFGAAVNLTDDQVQKLQTQPGVTLVPDTPLAGADAVVVPWALDRVDQKHLPLDQSFDPPRSHPHARVYVLDTGIRADHEQLQGRVHMAASFVPIVAGASPTPDQQNLCKRHGTAMASLMAGESLGVSRAIAIIDVAVLPCPPQQGRATDVVAGLDWVMAQEQASDKIGPAVVNLSLAGPRSELLDMAASALVDQGLIVVAAAGNAGREPSDSCQQSPAAARGVVSVTATNAQDGLADFAMGGGCIDMAAPGVDVLTASSLAPDDYARTNGTSEAAALVSAMIAAAGDVDVVKSIPLIPVAVQQAAADGIAAPARIPLARRADVVAPCQVQTKGGALNMRGDASRRAQIIEKLDNHSYLWPVEQVPNWALVVSGTGARGWVARQYTTCAPD